MKDKPSVVVWLLRKKMNLTQEQFAKKFNRTKRTIQRWEAGKTFPNKDLKHIFKRLLKTYCMDK